MGAAITYLSTTITIGHQTLTLQTDTFPDLGEVAKKVGGAKNALKQKFHDGIAFKMDPGEMVSINLGHMVEWIEGLGEKATKFGWPDAFTHLLSAEAQKALDDVSVDLWNLSINTKGSLSFNLRINLDPSFETDLGIPAEVANVFRLDSLGLGFSYQSKAAGGGG